MTNAPDLSIVMGDIPDDERDETPVASGDSESTTSKVEPDSTQWFNPEYPHSTEQHPYGYFTGSDGLPDFTRPRKRKPHGRRASAPSARMPASHNQADMAANVLKTLNQYVAMSLQIFGMPMSSQQMMTANDEFRDMAYQALLHDPEMCAKILSAGTASGRAQLTMAYVMLGGTLAPCVIAEVKQKRADKTEGFDE